MTADFSDAKRSLTLTIGAAFDLPITLTLGATQAVTVNAKPLCSKPTAARSQRPSRRTRCQPALQRPQLPRSRAAGARRVADQHRSQPTLRRDLRRAGQGISVSSQRNFSNSFIVDGLSANDDAAGLVQTSFGLDVIQEMQVVTSGGQAEFGRALGGYINFVSKSGGNNLHGDVYGYLRDKNLNAHNASTHTLLPYTQSSVRRFARAARSSKTAPSTSPTSSSVNSTRPASSPSPPPTPPRSTPC